MKLDIEFIIFPYFSLWTIKILQLIYNNNNFVKDVTLTWWQYSLGVQNVRSQ